MDFLFEVSFMPVYKSGYDRYTEKRIFHTLLAPGHIEAHDVVCDYAKKQYGCELVTDSTTKCLELEKLHLWNIVNLLEENKRGRLNG